MFKVPCPLYLLGGVGGGIESKVLCLHNLSIYIYRALDHSQRTLHTLRVEVVGDFTPIYREEIEIQKA